IVDGPESFARGIRSLRDPDDPSVVPFALPANDAFDDAGTYWQAASFFPDPVSRAADALSAPRNREALIRRMLLGAEGALTLRRLSTWQLEDLFLSGKILVC